MPEPSITVLADSAALAQRAADRFIELVGAALHARDVAHVALAGGSTPRAMNALLSAEPRRSALDWTKVRFFFGDERCVPPDDAESNYRMTRETLLDPLAIAPAQVHRIAGEDDPPSAAQAYEAVLTADLGPGLIFDLVFLGMGPDGHTASLFPGTLAAMDMSRAVVANFVPKFDRYRITITPRVINAARHVTITAGGAEKADALAAVLHGPHLPDTYPSQLVAPVAGELHWLVDAAAASKLDAG
jgi:6-phosphogluconolactonase